jgi:hypothetical protein
MCLVILDIHTRVRVHMNRERKKEANVKWGRLNRKEESKWKAIICKVGSQGVYIVFGGGGGCHYVGGWEVPFWGMTS